MSLQSLRAIGEGSTHATNPNLWVRQRYGKLYENFRPEVSWWRLLLILRKFLLAWATIMFNGNAMFQVRRRVSARVCALLLARPADCSLTVPCRGCRVRPQASFSIFVLFVSYVLHANYSPFLPRVTMQSLQEISAVEPDAKTLAAGGKNRRAKVAPALVVKTADFVRAGPRQRASFIWLWTCTPCWQRCCRIG